MQKNGVEFNCIYFLECEESKIVDLDFTLPAA